MHSVTIIFVLLCASHQLLAKLTPSTCICPKLDFSGESIIDNKLLQDVTSTTNNICKELEKCKNSNAVLQIIVKTIQGLLTQVITLLEKILGGVGNALLGKLLKAVIDVLQAVLDLVNCLLDALVGTSSTTTTTTSGGSGDPDGNNDCSGDNSASQSDCDSSSSESGSGNCSGNDSDSDSGGGSDCGCNGNNPPNTSPCDCLKKILSIYIKGRKGFIDCGTKLSNAINSATKDAKCDVNGCPIITCNQAQLIAKATLQGVGAATQCINKIEDSVTKEWAANKKKCRKTTESNGDNSLGLDIIKKCLVANLKNIGDKLSALLKILGLNLNIGGLLNDLLKNIDLSGIDDILDGVLGGTGGLGL